MGREKNYQNKVAYLAFDDLKIFYSARAPIVENNNNNSSSTTTIIIVLSCLFGVLVFASAGFLILRQRNGKIRKYKSFDDKKRADLEIKLKDFSVDF